MKKILFYVHSLNKGGAERVLLTLAEELNKEDEYEAVIMTDTIDELEYDIRFDIKRINLADMGADSAISRIKAIRRVVKEQDPDKVVVFMLSSVIRAVIALICTSYKVIGSVRSNPYDDYSDPKSRALLLSCVRRTEKIVCQTDYQIEFFPRSLRDRCVVISNPIFPEFALKARYLSNKDLESSDGEGYGGAGDGRKKIVATGRLFDYKNHKLLIDAFAPIEAEYPDTDLVIYGEGPYREELEKEINRLGLHRVFLPGDSKTVAEDIADAYIYVLPSDTEGLPNALMEAMALGLPVISTDCPCGGPKSLIRDGENGLLTPVGDIDRMKEAIVRLLTDEDLRVKIGSNAKEILKTNDLNSIVKQWENIL